MKRYIITHGGQKHGIWEGETKEDAFKACRKWYGPRMPRFIELYDITEIDPQSLPVNGRPPRLINIRKRK